MYGNGFNKKISDINSNIRWFGSFSPNEIITQLKGDFGLIWDGDSAEGITGLAGNYMRYNTPHKTSLYIAAGLPLIVSENAAIASFVTKNKVGICVGSLAEISFKALTTTPAVYTEMKKNVLRIGENIRSGF